MSEKTKGFTVGEGCRDVTKLCLRKLEVIGEEWGYDRVMSEKTSHTRGVGGMTELCLRKLEVIL